MEIIEYVITDYPDFYTSCGYVILEDDKGYQWTAEAWCVFAMDVEWDPETLKRYENIQTQYK